MSAPKSDTQPANEKVLAEAIYTALDNHVGNMPTPSILTTRGRGEIASVAAKAVVAHLAAAPRALPAVPTCGKDWEDLPPERRPMFWATPVFNGARYRVAQLIFRTNDDAEDYVKRHMPDRLAEAKAAWETPALPSLDETREAMSKHKFDTSEYLHLDEPKYTPALPADDVGEEANAILKAALSVATSFRPAELTREELETLTTILQQNARLAAALAGERDAKFKLEAALRAKDAAMDVLFARMRAAGVSYEDLIP